MSIILLVFCNQNIQIPVPRPLNLESYGRKFNIIKWTENALKQRAETTAYDTIMTPVRLLILKLV